MSHESVQQAQARAELLFTEHKAKGQDPAKVHAVLTLKARNLGRRYRRVNNPFVGWSHPMAQELAVQFAGGQVQ